MCLKAMTSNTKYARTHTHRYTFPHGPSLWLLSLHGIGVELPVGSSENQAATDSAGRPVCAIQTSNNPCLVGQNRGPSLPKSLLSRLLGILGDVVLVLTSR